MSGGTAPILTGSARLVNTRTTEKVTHSRPFYDACVSHDVHTPVPARGPGPRGPRAQRPRPKRAIELEVPAPEVCARPGVLSRGPILVAITCLLLRKLTCVA